MKNLCLAVFSAFLMAMVCTNVEADIGSTKPIISYEGYLRTTDIKKKKSSLCVERTGDAACFGDTSGCIPTDTYGITANGTTYYSYTSSAQFVWGICESTGVTAHVCLYPDTGKMCALVYFYESNFCSGNGWYVIVYVDNGCYV